MAISGENDAEDALHDRVTFIENLVVAEAQHEEAECFEGSGAPSVSLAPLLVYRTVHFDDQAELRTKEVDDEPSDHHLPGARIPRTSLAQRAPRPACGAGPGGGVIAGCSCAKFG